MTYSRRQLVADRQIKRFGARCVLRRDGSDRDCWAVVVEYHPRERNEMIGATDRVAMISVVDLDIAPDKEAGDQLITFAEDGIIEDQVFNLVAETGKLQQSREIIYWELQVKPE